MELAMSTTAFNLIITDEGYKAYTKLLSEKKEIKFDKVAVGSKPASGNYTPPDHKTTALINQKDRMDVSLCQPVPGDESKLRINATIPQGSPGGTYDIHEIGLFIGETLFGIYGDVNSLGQKIPTVDLLLDFIIDIKGFDIKGFETGNYQPQFTVALATQTTPGLVQLATLEDAKHQVKGRVLTTELLSQEEFIPRRCLVDVWTEETAYTTSIALSVPHEEYSRYKLPIIIGSYYDQNDTITLFCSDAQFVRLYQYSITSKQVINEIILNAHLYCEGFRFSDACTKDGKIWFATAGNVLAKFSLVSSDTLQYQRVSGFENGYFGRVCYQNGYVYFCGISEFSSGKNICRYDIQKNIIEYAIGSLSFERGNSVVLQVVQEKIYCFGGNNKTDGTEGLIEFLVPMGDRLTSFSRLDAFSNVDFTKCTTSAIAGHRSYLFQANEYYRKSQDVFYSFDLLTNIIEKHDLPSHIVINRPEALPQQGVAVACGNGKICFINSYVEPEHINSNVPLYDFTLKFYLYTPSI
jgi:hypothetical protein